MTPDTSNSPGFQSIDDYTDFASFVMRKSRHVRDEKNERFLRAVLDTSRDRVVLIDKNTSFWRSQKGFEVRTERLTDEDGNEVDTVKVQYPFPPERMKPLSDRATEGRVNPKGIPCLYLSTDEQTAIAEARPWIGAHVSVAEFVVLRNLSVVDCSGPVPRWNKVRFLFRKDPPTRVELLRVAWEDVNTAFSTPVERDEDSVAYVPTQVLSEAFRNAGFDGIMYCSRVGLGKTVALFDLTAAELINCCLHSVEGIKFEVKKTHQCY
jgi:hypothetical protein